MRIGIDASNLRSGGAVKYLNEIISRADPVSHGISSVIVWSAGRILDQLPERAWLMKASGRLLDGNLMMRQLWQHSRLPRLAAQECDVLYVPGGTYTGSFHPFVTASQNLLPFAPKEWRRYGYSWTRFRLFLLSLSQTATYRRADGVIFLTNTAKQVVEFGTGPLHGATTIIPFGIQHKPFDRDRLSAVYNFERPFRLLYVSIVDVYKHQWHVAEAVGRLRQEGLPVTLTLVGPAYPPAALRLKDVLRQCDPDREFVSYLGAVSPQELEQLYASADGFVFASSCENMPNILLEAMAAGLPIACSNRGPMPEVLKDGGVYFDPEDPDQIARTVRELVINEQKRVELAECAHELAGHYTWEECADRTFAFLAAVGKAHAGASGGDRVKAVK